MFSAKQVLFFLLLLALPLTARAQQFTAALDPQGRCVITGFTPTTATSITIPSTFQGYTVQGIYDGAFWFMPNLQSVTIPNSVTYIGTSAFLSDPLLTTINFGTGLTSIGDYAFETCPKLQNVTIPASVTTIGQSAFDGDSALTSIVIPNNVTSLGASEFANCTGLTSVTIGTGVTSIGDLAFEFCTSLHGITIPNNVTTLGVSTFEFCTGLTSVTLSNRLTTIPTSAFDQCTALQGVTIPDSVTSISTKAFNNCNALANLTLGRGVSTIGDQAFDLCFALTSLTIPSNVTSIGVQSFYDCNGITSLTLNSGLTTIGNEAFLDSYHIASLTIPATVNTIGAGAFAGCSGLHAINVSASNPDFSTSADGVLFNKSQTRLVQFPSGVLGGSYAIPATTTSIADEAFYDAELSSITIPNSVTSIGAGVFSFDIFLTNITIPNSVTAIGTNAFYFCSDMTSITIPGSVTTIGANAFEYSGLTSVTIPASVTNIGQQAFYYASHLASAQFLGNAPTMGSSVFLNTATGFHVFYLPSATGFQSPTWTDSAGDFYSAGAALLAQTITFPTLGILPYPSAPVDLMASASSGLPVSFQYVSGPASFSNGVLTITGVGTVVVLAAQGGNGTYAAATSVYQNITVEPTQTVSDWSTSYAITDLAATPAHDGVPNLLKYLYHIDPTTAMSPGDQTALPKVSKDTTTTPGTTYLTMTYREYAGLSGVTVQVQSSTNLQAWTTVTPDFTVQSGTDPVTNDPIMSVEVKATALTQFIRLNVTAQ